MKDKLDKNTSETLTSKINTIYQILDKDLIIQRTAYLQFFNTVKNRLPSYLAPCTPYKNNNEWLAGAILPITPIAFLVFSSVSALVVFQNMIGALINLAVVGSELLFGKPKQAKKELELSLICTQIVGLAFLATVVSAVLAAVILPLALLCLVTRSAVTAVGNFYNEVDETSEINSRAFNVF